MQLLLVFAITLTVAALLSARAQRSVMSAAVLFLAVGMVYGYTQHSMGGIHTKDLFVEYLAEITLFAVLFADGMKVAVSELRSAWRLPGRALLFGMPITFGITAVFAHWILAIDWPEAFLVGAALSPTDPVFASVLIGRKDVPKRLRRLLNVESGLNDGLALPAVIALIAFAGAQSFEPITMSGELALGVVLGVALPLGLLRMEKSRFFATAHDYVPIHIIAIGVLLFAISKTWHANEFLAAFAGGVCVASYAKEFREKFEEFGELITELLKLLTLLVFGILFADDYIGLVGGREWLFALATLFLVRPLALAISLYGSQMAWAERLAAAWFGPKGFALSFTHS